MLEIVVFYDEFPIEGDVQEVTFMDHLTGQLDEITIRIADTGHRWLGSWVPKKNDRVRFEASLDGMSLKSPDFFLDTWEIGAYPGQVTLRALSEATQSGRNPDAKKPGSELRKKRTVNYHDTTLRGLVSGIAQRNGLKLIWEGDDTPPVKVLRQRNTSDLAYLRKIAQDTGRVCKLQNGYLIFIPLSFGGTRLERLGDTVRLVPQEGKRTIVIRPEDMIAQVEVTHSGEVPNAREFRKYLPIQARLDRVRGTATEETFDAGVETGINTGFGLETAAWSTALEAHLAGVTIRIGTLPRVDVAAGSVVYLDGIGVYTGTYLVHDLTHRIGGNGWSCEHELGRLSEGTITPPDRAKKWEERVDRTAFFMQQVLDEDRRARPAVTMPSEASVVRRFLTEW